MRFERIAPPILERRNMNGIILAGGKSSRFGENKALAKIEDQPLIERTACFLGQFFPKVYIIANTPDDYQYLGLEIRADLIKGRGPLGGIHAGLTASTGFKNFITACDMPYLSRELICHLAKSSVGFDLVVPRFSGRLQPLCAVYTKTCLPQIERQLTEGDLRLTGLIEAVNSRIIEEDEITAIDPAGSSFANINTKEDYAAISR